MERKSKTQRNKDLSPEMELLVKDLLALPPGELLHVPDLASRLRSLSLAGKEVFFTHLFNRGGEPILPLCEALSGKEEDLDAAMVRGLGNWNSPRAGEFLRRWAGRKPSKNLGKEIRRSLFRLRSKGISVEEGEDESPGVFRLPQTSPAQGYLSAIDSRGSRLIWIVRSQPAQGTMVLSSLISDTDGIIDFSLFESSRKKFHDYLDQMRRDFAWQIVEADPDYCGALVHQANEIGGQKGKAPHPEYIKFQNWVGPKSPRPLPSLIYRFVAEEEIKGHPELIDRSPSLFQTPFFQMWFLEKEEVQKYLRLLEEASQSRLILAPHQQESRVFEIYRQAVQELFNENRRLLFRRRLEEMAYILWKKDLPGEARITLSAAAGLAEEDKVLSPHLFLLELVKRTLLFYLEEKRQEKEKEKNSGLILPP